MAVKKICRYFLAVVLMLFAAACITEVFFKSVNLNYCKSIISYRDGVAAIQEGSMIDTIFYADSEGRLLEQLEIPYTNYIKGEIRNYETLFTDDEGNLYVYSRVYRKNGVVTREISQCRFDLGVLQKKWQIETPEGCTYVEEHIPTIVDGILYLAWLEDDTGNLLTYAYESSGASVCVDRIEINTEIDETLYTPCGLAVVTSSDGVYWQGSQVYYKGKNNTLVDGIYYENGAISFYDQYLNQLVTIDAEGQEAATDCDEFYDFGRYQSVRMSSNGSFTACYENGADLGGILVKNGQQQIYEKITGDFQWQVFAHLFAVILIIALFVLLIRRLLGLISGKNLLQKKNVRFVSLTSTTAMISALVTVLLTLAISYNIDDKIKSSYEFWITADCQSAAKYVIGRLISQTFTINDDGVLSLGDDAVEFMDQVAETYNDKMESSGQNESYDFVVLTYWNDELYCIYSGGMKEATLASNVISNSALDNVLKIIETEDYSRFEDKWSTGLLKYTVEPVSMYNEDAGTIPLVVAAINDGYQEALYYLTVVPKVLVVIFMISILLWILINIILSIFLKRVKNLGNALKIYGDTGDFENFDLKGGDEIGQTAHVLHAMAGGIEVHKNDITESNSNYQKLLPSGIVQLMGKERITQVNVGEYSKVEANMLLFTFKDKAQDAEPDRVKITRDEQLQQVLEFGQGYQGIVTHFNRDELYMVVSTKWNITELMQSFELEIGTDKGIELKAASGSFDVGSAGSEENAYLTATGKVFRQLLTLENREKGEVNG
jgi:hypothetical protein